MIKHNNLLKAIGVLFFIVILVTSCKTSTRGENPVLLKVLWSKKDTSHNNYRIPSIIVTKQNTLLAFSEGREKGDSGNIDILLKRSSDNGNTWEEQIVVWNDSNNTCGTSPLFSQRDTSLCTLYPPRTSTSISSTSLKMIAHWKGFTVCGSPSTW